MRYVLRKDVIGDVPEIEISAAEYLQYKRARKVLVNAFAIEEKYEILISNYLEFEKQILELAAGHMIRDRFDYDYFFELRLGLNVRLVNFLTAARLYKDQLKNNVRQCAANADEAATGISQAFSYEYDTNRDYRFMDEFRNFVQHRGIPVHWIQTNSEWIEDRSLLEHTVEFAAERSYLAEDSKFKKKVLRELEEKVDLKSATRSYMQSMSSIHHSAKQLIEEPVTGSRQLIEHAMSQYASKHDGTLVGLVACEASPEGYANSVPLLLDWDNIRIELQKRNRIIYNLSKQYATGRSKFPEK